MGMYNLHQDTGLLREVRFRLFILFRLGVHPLLPGMGLRFSVVMGSNWKHAGHSFQNFQQKSVLDERLTAVPSLPAQDGSLTNRHGRILISIPIPKI